MVLLQPKQSKFEQLNDSIGRTTNREAERATVKRKKNEKQPLERINHPNTITTAMCCTMLIATVMYGTMMIANAMRGEMT